VVDYKKVLVDWSGFGVVTANPEDVLYHPRVVFQPRMVDLMSPDPDGRDPWSRFLHYVYEYRGDPAWRPGQPASLVLVLDEAAILCPTDAHPTIRDIVVSGRGRGLSVWASSQRPQKVFSSLLSESTHVLAWRLKLARDRGKLESDLGIGCDQLRTLPDHQFMYHRSGSDGWAGPLIFEP